MNHGVSRPGRMGLRGQVGEPGLAVLARKAGWHEQASSIALSAAASPLLAGTGTRLAAERGLLIQSAAYTPPPTPPPVPETATGCGS
jgi:hypothetical protein